MTTSVLTVSVKPCSTKCRCSRELLEFAETGMEIEGPYLRRHVTAADEQRPCRG